MLLKVTITEGMGSIRCPFPAFTLNEEPDARGKIKKSAFVSDRTDQLKNLEDEGIVSIVTITEGQYQKELEKVSKRLTDNAIGAKRKRLKKLIKGGSAGGKIITGSGLEFTVEPGDVSPEELAAEAKKDLSDMEATIEANVTAAEEDEKPNQVEEFLRSSTG